MKKEEIRSQSYDRELQRHRCKNLQRHEFLFGSTTLLTRTTGNSLRMQWPLTSQLHGSVSQREQLFFLLRIKLHALIRLGVSPPSFDTGARNGVLCGSQQSH
jgi:uncharacterized membrane protein YhfC